MNHFACIWNEYNIVNQLYFNKNLETNVYSALFARPYSMCFFYINLFNRYNDMGKLQ